MLLISQKNIHVRKIRTHASGSPGQEPIYSSWFLSHLLPVIHIPVTSVVETKINFIIHSCIDRHCKAESEIGQDLVRNWDKSEMGRDETLIIKSFTFSKLDPI